jgi:hypothetical protein
LARIRAAGRVEVDLVVVGGPDRGCDIVGIGVLEDEPLAPDSSAREHLVLFDERGQRHDLDRRLGGLDPSDGPRSRRAAA